MNLTEKTPIGAIVAAIREAGLEGKALEGILVAIQDEGVRRLCGERYARGNGTRPCARAGTAVRGVKTLAGAVSIPLVKVRDRATGRIFPPLGARVGFAPGRTYQDDVCLVGCELVTKMTYRDAVMEAKRFQPAFPSRHTIRRRLPEFAQDLDALAQETLGDGFDVVMADGTKVRSTAPRGHHAVNVILGKRGDETTLLRVCVGGSWEHAARAVQERLAGAAVAVADGEPAIREAFRGLGRPVQQCGIHAARNVGYAMWKDGAPREVRARVKRDLVRLLRVLRRSVSKHKKDQDFERLAWRVNTTRREIRALAAELHKPGYHTAATFLDENVDAIVLFARYVPEGLDVPWSTNLIERLMGEISKRVKHKWMHWSDLGLDSLLTMLLTRLKNPPAYDAWWRRRSHEAKRPAVQIDMLRTLPRAEV